MTAKQRIGASARLMFTVAIEPLVPHLVTFKQPLQSHGEECDLQ